MRVLIVDDEMAARERLKIMLEELDVEVVGEASNGVDALAQIRSRTPDLVLLDIQMPEVDGFDVAQHLEDPKPFLVFQTAFDQYALAAFDHSAIDYLVKPVTLDLLRRSVDRVQQRLTDREPAGLPSEVLSTLRDSLQSSRTQPRRLLVREGSGHRLVEISQVERAQAVDGAITIFTQAGSSHACDYTLSDLERRTVGWFVRPNRAELVSIAHVVHIRSNGDGSATMRLKSGIDTHVTRRRAAAVRTQLESLG